MIHNCTRPFAVNIPRTHRNFHFAVAYNPKVNGNSFSVVGIFDLLHFHQCLHLRKCYYAVFKQKRIWEFNETFLLLGFGGRRRNERISFVNCFTSAYKPTLNPICLNTVYVYMSNLIGNRTISLRLGLSFWRHANYCNPNKIQFFFCSFIRRNRTTEEKLKLGHLCGVM